MTNRCEVARDLSDEDKNNGFQTMISAVEWEMPFRSFRREGVKASLAATSDIHRAADAIKMLLVGADVTKLCSVLMRHGIKHISVIEHDLRAWLEEHEYDSVEQLKGSMSQKNCDDPHSVRQPAAQFARCGKGS